MRARRTAAFRGLLDHLPDEQAETFALRVVLDYSLDQVARRDGRARQHRAQPRAPRAREAQAAHRERSRAAGHAAR